MSFRITSRLYLRILGAVLGWAIVEHVQQAAAEAAAESIAPEHELLMAVAGHQGCLEERLRALEPSAEEEA